MFENKWIRRLTYLIILFLLAVVFDRVIMPWYVDLGHEIKMPDVVERTETEAGNLLRSKGFNVIIADSVYDAHYPQGTVIEQRPVAYSTVKVGRNVYLTISSGEKALIMPNLYGKSAREAEIILNTMQLKLRNIRYEYSELYPEGAIIGQSFPQGQEIEKNSAITITVSLGEKPSLRTMPGLVGKSLSAARQQLRQLNAGPVEIEYEENENYLSNTVLNQKPAQGTLLQDVDKIVLYVSRLPRNKTEQ